MKKKQVDLEQKEGKKRGLFRSLLLFLIIPLIFISIILGIVFSLLGYNVMGGIKDVVGKVPFISSSIGETGSSSSSEEKKLQTINDKQKEKISDLEKILEEKQAEIRSLQIESQRLSKDLEKDNSGGQGTTTISSSMKKIIASYEEMSPKQAAQIIKELPEDEATLILSKVKPDILGEILASLDAKTAAKFTSLVANETN